MNTPCPHESKTILLVDDDIDFLTQIRLRLEAAGYDVMTAENESDAEAILSEKRPDLAIVDLMMDQTDGGFALSYHIKKKYPDTPVIIVTAVSSETGLEFDATTPEERSWIKAEALLDKPIRFEQLQKEIDRLTS